MENNSLMCARCGEVLDVETGAGHTLHTCLRDVTIYKTTQTSVSTTEPEVRDGE